MSDAIETSNKTRTQDGLLHTCGCRVATAHRKVIQFLLGKREVYWPEGGWVHLTPLLKPDGVVVVVVHCSLPGT